MTAPTILALDISKTSTGVADGRAGEVPTCYTIKGQGLEDRAAAKKLGHWLLDRLSATPIDWVFYEAPLSGGVFRPDIDWEAREWHHTRDPNTAVTLAKMVGVAEFVLDMKKVANRSAHIKSVRKEFIGSANLKGPEAKKRARAMCRLLGWQTSNNDESDACAVWHYATTIVAKNYAVALLPTHYARAAEQEGSREGV